MPYFCGAADITNDGWFISASFLANQSGEKSGFLLQMVILWPKIHKMLIKTTQRNSEGVKRKNGKSAWHPANMSEPPGCWVSLTKKFSIMHKCNELCIKRTKWNGRRQKLTKFLGLVVMISGDIIPLNVCISVDSVSPVYSNVIPTVEFKTWNEIN